MFVNNSMFVKARPEKAVRKEKSWQIYEIIIYKIVISKNSNRYYYIPLYVYKYKCTWRAGDIRRFMILTLWWCFNYSYVMVFTNPRDLWYLIIITHVCPRAWQEITENVNLLYSPILTPFQTFVYTRMCATACTVAAIHYQLHDLSMYTRTCTCYKLYIAGWSFPQEFRWICHESGVWRTVN